MSRIDKFLNFIYSLLDSSNRVKKRINKIKKIKLKILKKLKKIIIFLCHNY